MSKLPDENAQPCMPPLLVALNDYQGVCYCYTGGAFCGKSSYAMLLAIYLKNEEEETVAVLDLNDRPDLADNALDAGIGVINAQQDDVSKIAEALEKYEAIVIDAPIAADLPLGFPLGKAALKAIKSSKDEELYCQEWYQKFFHRMDRSMFVLTDNDKKGYTYGALAILDAYRVEVHKRSFGYFISKSRTESEIERYVINYLKEMQLKQSATPLTSCDEYFNIISEAKTIDPEDDIKTMLPWLSEYYEHYHSFHNTSDDITCFQEWIAI